MEKNIKITAPELDSLLRSFHNGIRNLEPTTPAIRKAMQPLFDALADLAPHKKNDELKTIWIWAPRGTIDDFGSFEEYKEWGCVNTYQEFEDEWKMNYPDEVKWYELIIAENLTKDKITKYRVVDVDKTSVISADLDAEDRMEAWTDDTAIELCNILTVLAKQSMHMLHDGTYNDYVEQNIPYQYRTGVVQRKDMYEYFPDMKENVFEGLSDDVLQRFKELVTSGANDKNKIGRIEHFTANDFFRACAIGYKACGYEGTDLPLVKQYFMHADGRDEGLTGKGHGLNAGPGIDFDDPKAWDTWFHDKTRFGGHPWEVCRGGNSTHVSLCVIDGKEYSKYDVIAGHITQEEADNMPAGYYFIVSGNAWNRAVETVNFYVAIHDAGLPIIMNDAEAILARFLGEDNVGIVPHNYYTSYCEGMFPEEYGVILDFIHLYSAEFEKIGNKVTWLPMDKSYLLNAESHLHPY